MIHIHPDWISSAGDPCLVMFVRGRSVLALGSNRRKTSRFSTQWTHTVDLLLKRSSPGMLGSSRAVVVVVKCCTLQLGRERMSLHTTSAAVQPHCCKHIPQD